MDISNYHLEFFRKQFDFFGMVSMKLWVGEEKWEPDYFKVGKKPDDQGLCPNIDV